MLEVKQAVQIAKQKAEEMLGRPPIQLEEVEREKYKGREVWSITLSFPIGENSPLAKQLIAGPLRRDVDYKRFLIDTTSGDLVAMKIREFVS